MCTKLVEKNTESPEKTPLKRFREKEKVIHKKKKAKKYPQPVFSTHC